MSDILQSFIFAIKSLKANKTRTALTILGVVIGIAAVIVVISSGEGLRNMIMSQIDMFGSDTIEIEIKVPNTSQVSTDNAMGVATGIMITTLRDEDRKAIIREMPEITDGYSAVLGQEQVTRDDKRERTIIFGCSASMINVDPGKVENGRFFTESEEKGLAQVVVLGSKIQEDLFGKSSAVGQTVKIKNKRFRVIGVMESKGAAAFFDMDDMVYIPIKTLQKKIMGIEHVQMIMLKIDKGADAEMAVKTMTQIMRDRHGTTNLNSDDFAIITMEEAKEMVGVVLSALQILLVALAGISLVVGGVSIMNVAYVNVQERIFEIGLRKALGAQQRDILFQFLWESVLVSLLGAIVGIIIGAIITAFITSAAVSRGFTWSFTIPLSAVLISVIFSSVVGIAFGYFPAKSAARKDAIESLVAR